jgi:hypothetical protein
METGDIKVRWNEEQIEQTKQLEKQQFEPPRKRPAGKPSPGIISAPWPQNSPSTPTPTGASWVRPGTAAITDRPTLDQTEKGRHKYISDIVNSKAYILDRLKGAEAGKKLNLDVIHVLYEDPVKAAHHFVLKTPRSSVLRLNPTESALPTYEERAQDGYTLAKRPMSARPSSGVRNSSYMNHAELLRKKHSRGFSASSPMLSLEPMHPGSASTAIPYSVRHYASTITPFDANSPHEHNRVKSATSARLMHSSRSHLNASKQVPQQTEQNQPASSLNVLTYNNLCEQAKTSVPQQVIASAVMGSPVLKQAASIRAVLNRMEWERKPFYKRTESLVGSLKGLRIEEPLETLNMPEIIGEIGIKSARTLAGNPKNSQKSGRHKAEEIVNVHMYHKRQAALKRQNQKNSAHLLS